MRPTYNSKSMSSIFLGSNRRSTASITIPIHSETRNTEFIKGPNTSALTQPNVFLVDFRLDI